MIEPCGVPILAVDFDGCLCDSSWPELGDPIMPVLSAAKRRQEQGWKIILWTCRCGEALQKAVEWCRDWGLVFDAVNDNLPEVKAAYGGNSRKITATEYWDDRAAYMGRDTP